VIGRRAERVAENDAWAHVAGLTVGQDISEREIQMAGLVPQLSMGKSFGLFRKPPVFLAPGDTLVSWVKGIGELCNPVTAGYGYPDENNDNNEAANNT